MEATSRYSRRAIIAAGLGGLAAAVVHAAGSPPPAQAGHDGTNVFHLGESNHNPPGANTVLDGNSEEPTISFINSAQGQALGISGTVHIGANVNNGTALSILNTHTGAGASGVGVQAAGGEPAVDGLNNGPGIGVQGRSGFGGDGPGIGVQGLSGSGTGVLGHSDSGFGGEFSSNSGTALRCWAEPRSPPRVRPACLPGRTCLPWRTQR